MTLVDDIRNNWAILVFICAMIIWYANTNARLNSVEAEQEDYSTIFEKINQMAIDMAVVKNDVSIIKTNLQ
jgi:hypothetical protein